MFELEQYTNDKFGAIRVTMINGEPWFVGKDVAEALGYKQAKEAVHDHVDPDDKRLVKGGEIPLLKVSNFGAYIINESGLYSLILSSKLPTAREFKHWVSVLDTPPVGNETLRTSSFLPNSTRLNCSHIIYIFIRNRGLTYGIPYVIIQARSKGGGYVAPNKKMGRPTDNPRDQKIGFRMSKEEIDDIQKCADKMQTQRVNAVVKGIHLLKKQLNIEDEKEKKE